MSAGIPFRPASLDTWHIEYGQLVRDVRRVICQAVPGFDPVARWRGIEHHIVLRNIFVDVGLTTGWGWATIWIGRRIDRDFVRRAGWRPEIVAHADRWLARTGPDCIAASHALGAEPRHEAREPVPMAA